VDEVGPGAAAAGIQLRQGQVGVGLAASGGDQQVVHGLLRVGVAEVAAPVDQADVVIGADLADAGLAKVLQGHLRLRHHQLAFVVEAP
nr:hypothetical protein [Tanacetum cinerariifolium]